jgi:hypothetical protein
VFIIVPASSPSRLILHGRQKRLALTQAHALQQPRLSFSFLADRVLQFPRVVNYFPYSSSVVSPESQSTLPTSFPMLIPYKTAQNVVPPLRLVFAD